MGDGVGAEVAKGPRPIGIGDVDQIGIPPHQEGLLPRLVKDVSAVGEELRVYPAPLVHQLRGHGPDAGQVDDVVGLLVDLVGLVVDEGDMLAVNPLQRLVGLCIELVVAEALVALEDAVGSRDVDAAVRERLLPYLQTELRGELGELGERSRWPSGVVGRTAAAGEDRVIRPRPSS